MNHCLQYSGLGGDYKWRFSLIIRHGVSEEFSVTVPFGENVS